MRVADDYVPSFTELTGGDSHRASSAYSLDKDGFSYHRQLCATRRDWLQNIKAECARLTAVYLAGEFWLPCDAPLVYNEDDARFAREHHIDYLGLCLFCCKHHKPGYDLSLDRALEQIKRQISEHLEDIARIQGRFSD